MPAQDDSTVTARADAGRGLRSLPPAARIAAVADPGSVESLDAPRPSRWLARVGIVPQDDDGLVTARMRIGDATWLVAAQDERFLGGSVGARHGEALRALFLRACAERPAGVALLAASGGVRLHEANGAELALARALRALLDARSAGVRTAAIAVGDVFGGASVLACATGSLAMLPGTRLGLSGPKVVESARGRGELDSSDRAAIARIYGAEARARNGQSTSIPDDARAVRDWLAAPATPATLRAGTTMRAPDALPDTTRILARAGATADAEPSTLVGAEREPLDPRWHATPVRDGLWRGPEAWIVAASGRRHVAAAGLRALDRALLANVGVTPGAPSVLVLVEDSDGHEVSRAAEVALLSDDLARHAQALQVLRARGVRIVGALTGIGHSAAFFANALQSDALCAARSARVIAMAPEAIARITGLPAGDRIEDDPMLGQPVRHLAALDPAIALLDDASPSALLDFARGATAPGGPDRETTTGSTAAGAVAKAPRPAS